MTARRLLSLLGLMTILCSALPGCGGGGGASPNATTGNSIFTNTSPSPTPTQSPAIALADLGIPTTPTISGTISGNNFTIPTGTTITATGDLTVVARKNITINGTLILPPTAKVYLVAANAISVAGTISGPPVAAARLAPVATLETPTSLLDSLLAYGKVYAAANDNTSLPGLSLFAQTISVPGSIVLGTGNPAPFVSMATIGTGTVTVDGLVVAGTGAPGTSTTVATVGGNTTVGTERDLLTALALNVEDVQAPLLVQGRGAITGGFGGQGFNDVSGTAGAGALVYAGGAGATGGRVDIVAGQVTTTNLVLSGGPGGKGGSAGPATNAAAPVLTTPTILGTAGIDVSATSGNGGAGGALALGGKFVRQGIGGQPGDVFVGAGNGGPSGRGGNLVITMGTPGSGTVGTAISSLVIIAPGGNGGAAPSPATAGGAGGNLTINVPTGFTLANSVTIAAATGNGGAGASGCNATPKVAGSNGGAGGSATLSAGSLFGSVAVGAFVGGNGGSGNPPGAGGAAGTVQTFATTAGAAGATCP